jgi:SSS family solute:Na+ symporter
MLASLIIVPVVSLISAKTRPAGVDKMFSCYNTTVTVNTTEALTDAE